MNERGIGHVEAVLSFVIFIGFLIFIFIFFSPFNRGEVLDSSLIYAVDGIKSGSEIDFESYSVSLNTNELEVGVPLVSEIANAKVRVEGKNGGMLPSGYQGGVVYFNRQSLDIDFVQIVFSEDFIDLGIGSGNILEQENYSVSSSDIAKIHSEKKFLEMNDSYYSDYEELKRDLNLPGRVDFGFSVGFDSGNEIISEMQISEDLEVLAESDRIEIVRINGDIRFATLIVKVW